MDSFTLSEVGRVSVPFNDFNGNPFLSPAITLNLTASYLFKHCDWRNIDEIGRFLNVEKKNSNECCFFEVKLFPNSLKWGGHRIIPSFIVHIKKLFKRKSEFPD